MRHEDAQLQLWLASERNAQERQDLARTARTPLEPERPTLRQRAGLAVIALGERLAGDVHASGSRQRTRRLATRTW